MYKNDNDEYVFESALWDQEGRQKEILKRQADMIEFVRDAGREDFDQEERSAYEKLNRMWEELRVERESRKNLAFMSVSPMGDFEGRGGKDSGVIFDKKSLYKIAQDGAEYRFDPKGRELRDAFNRYLIGGNHALTVDETRALQADVATSGGFLITPKYVVAQLIKSLDNELPFRTRATSFILTQADSFRAPELATDLGDVTWTSELRTGEEDSDLDFSARDLFPHPLARRLKVSNKLLRLAVLNPEELVRQRMVYKIGAVLENAYMNGTGSNQPLGILTESGLGVDSSRDVTSSVQGSIKADDIFDVIKELKAGYRRKAIWLMSRETESRIRRLKDGEGNYLWIPGLQFDRPSTLAGFPVVLSEYAPSNWATSEYCACLCDPSFYWVVDSLQSEIRRLDELYQETNQTGYIVRYEGDGAPVVAEAFVRLKIG